MSFLLQFFDFFKYLLCHFFALFAILTKNLEKIFAMNFKGGKLLKIFL